MEDLSYQIPKPTTPLITFINFDLKNNLKYPITFTFNEEITEDDLPLKRYFEALKKGEYLMDIFSEEIKNQKYKYTRKMSYASFGDIFELNQDKIILFYNPENCKNWEDIVKNIEKTLDLLTSNGVIHVLGGYFDVSKNSLFGLDLEGKGDCIRYYKKGFKDLDDFSEVSVNSVSSFGDILSFVMDMSSEIVNIGYEGDL